MVIEMSGPSGIIDLTNSFVLVDHIGLSDVVIDLDTDDSLCVEVESPNDPELNATPTVNNVKSIESTTAEVIKKKNKKHKNDAVSPIAEKICKFGSCPICWDEIGKNPLASTICGHVYCINCIQEYLKREKKCPTCRKCLKGRNPYHRLYFS